MEGWGWGVCEIYGGLGEDKGGASRVGRDFCYLGFVMGGRDRRALGDGENEADKKGLLWGLS